MTTAALFWFYKDAALCAERLALFRRHNPGVAVFGLYGGPPADAEAMRGSLGPLLDDWYAFAEDRPAEWKWRHGDRLIAAWHRDRGAALPWDDLFILQWDMLVLAPLARLFAAYPSGELVLSGLRPVSEVSGWWAWVNGSNPEMEADYRAFRALLGERFGYGGPLYCGLFIVARLPRRFLDRYVAAGPPEAGFLEYKIPSLAAAFGVPLAHGQPFRPWWRNDPSTRDAPPRARVLNAVGDDVPLAVVLEELCDPAGTRLIHPCRARFSPWLSWRPLARAVATVRRISRRP